MGFFLKGKKEEDKKLLSGIIIHCADFNGTIKDFAISRKWSEKVNLEFFRQVREKLKIFIIFSYFLHIFFMIFSYFFHE